MTPMEGFYCFCENIRLLRQAHLLSKKEMADIMGINVKTLDMLEGNILPKHLSTGAKGNDQSQRECAGERQPEQLQRFQKALGEG